MDDYIKLLKVEFLSNHWLDIPQNLNLRSREKTTMKNRFNKDEIQWETTSNMKFEYQNNHLSDLPKVVNLNLKTTQSQKNIWNEDDF